jgi:ABC-2 type transport system ATP-binding protein
MLIVDGISKKLGPRQVLRAASLRHAGPGTLWIRGPNGIGKSTLLKCVAGVWRPDAGDVLLFGRSTVRDGAARARLGYVPDSFAPFPDLSVAEMLALVAALKRQPVPGRAVLERFGVAAFAHQGVLRLSAGQTRRAALVAGLIGDPWLLLLDEPASGLDADGVILLRQVLEERRLAGQANLLVSHDAHLALVLGAEVQELRDGALAPPLTPAAPPGTIG